MARKGSGHTQGTLTRKLWFSFVILIVKYLLGFKLNEVEQPLIDDWWPLILDVRFHKPLDWHVNLYGARYFNIFSTLGGDVCDVRVSIRPSLEFSIMTEKLKYLYETNK